MPSRSSYKEYGGDGYARLNTFIYILECQNPSIILGSIGIPNDFPTFFHLYYYFH